MSAGSMTTNGWPGQSVPFARALSAADAGELVEVQTVAEPLRQCRVCGCTDDDCTECLAKTGQACWWVASDLCSACQLAEL